jgi:hypothetical protein
VNSIEATEMFCSGKSILIQMPSDIEPGRICDWFVQNELIRLSVV